MKKNAQISWLDISQKKKHNGQWVYENIIKITNHQGNANQNHNGISPHSYLNGYHKNDKRFKYFQRYGENRTLVNSIWEIKLVQLL
jgi:aromatic ring-opening dioxygenase LigB subunit